VLQKLGGLARNSNARYVQVSNPSKPEPVAILVGEERAIDRALYDTIGVGGTALRQLKTTFPEICKERLGENIVQHLVPSDKLKIERFEAGSRDAVGLRLLRERGLWIITRAAHGPYEGVAKPALVRGPPHTEDC
jgi:hypothetical protein